MHDNEVGPHAFPSVKKIMINKTFAKKYNVIFNTSSERVMIVPPTGWCIAFLRRALFFKLRGQCSLVAVHSFEPRAVVGSTQLQLSRMTR